MSPRPPLCVELAVLAAGLAVLGGCSVDPPTPPSWRAEELSTDGVVRRLLDEQRAAVVSDPGNADHWLELGWSLQANGFSERAREAFEAALRMDAPTGQTEYHLALCELALEDLEAAIEHFDAAARAEPIYAPILWRQATAQLQLGALSAAELGFRRALELEPGSEPATVGLARVLLQQDRASEAEQLARRLVQGRAVPGYARHLLAAALRRQGRLVEAEEASRGAVAVPPSWTDAWSERLVRYRVGFGTELETASQALREGRVGEALPVLQRLFAERPSDPSVAGNLGGAYLAAGRFGEAIDVLGPAAQRHPELFTVVMNLAVASHFAGEPTTVDHARRAIELQPRAAAAHELLGMALLERGEVKPALEELAAATLLAGGDQALLLRVALVHHRAGRWARAAELFERLAADAPLRGDYSLALGRVRLELGDLAGAAAALDTAEQLGVPRAEELAAARAELAARLAP